MSTNDLSPATKNPLDFDGNITSSTQCGKTTFKEVVR